MAVAQEVPSHQDVAYRSLRLDAGIGECALPQSWYIVKSAPDAHELIQAQKPSAIVQNVAGLLELHEVRVHICQNCVND
jgi:hypothetical protein